MGKTYILKEIEKFGDGFALGIGKDVVVIHFRAACTSASHISQLGYAPMADPQEFGEGGGMGVDPERTNAAEEQPSAKIAHRVTTAGVGAEATQLAAGCTTKSSLSQQR